MIFGPHNKSRWPKLEAKDYNNQLSKTIKTLTQKTKNEDNLIF